MELSFSAEEVRRHARKCGFDVKELARLYGISPRQFQRVFRVQFGRSPQHWLNEERLAFAKELLLTDRTIKDIAGELGFTYTSYFCRFFKSRTGMTMSQFLHHQPGPYDI